MNKFYYYFLVVLFTVLFISCTKSEDESNNDPSDPPASAYKISKIWFEPRYNHYDSVVFQYINNRLFLIRQYGQDFGNLVISDWNYYYNDLNQVQKIEHTYSSSKESTNYEYEGNKIKKFFTEITSSGYKTKMSCEVNYNDQIISYCTFLYVFEEYGSDTLQIDCSNITNYDYTNNNISACTSINQYSDTLKEGYYQFDNKNNPLYTIGLFPSLKKTAMMQFDTLYQHVKIYFPGIEMLPGKYQGWCANNFDSGNIEYEYNSVGLPIKALLNGKSFIIHYNYIKTE